MSFLYEDTLKLLKGEIDEVLSSRTAEKDSAQIKNIDFLFKMIMEQKMIIATVFTGREEWLFSYFEKLDELMELITYIKGK
ncbi:hypothetical protein [Bacillus toyonensis]|uniref:hypothetical protein n=1 Tax=Bacillus toyonensis TaxID=155322 RepID=UPI002E1D7201|nr:hypothetical protein [Bacillus toyonensis]